MSPRISVDMEKIRAFCKKWRVKELSLFGSVLTDDFQPDSDVDVLVVFEDNAAWGLFDYFRTQDELKEIFGREVDLVQKNALHNPFRRHHIMNHHEVIYAA